MKRLLLACAALVAAHLAHAADGPIKIGILNDQNGIFSNDQGPGSVVAARMAVADFGKTVNRPIEILVGDHQNKPDIGNAITRQWLDEGVQLIMDVPNSAIALGVAEQARQHNKVFISSGGGTAELTGAKCSPNTVAWTYDTWSVAHDLVKAMLSQGYKSWFIIAADYTFGWDLQSQTEEAIKAGGGTVLGAVRAPLGTADFSSFLLQAQASHAQALMLANPGQDTINSLKQAGEFGLNKSMKLANPIVNPGQVHSMGLATAQGLFAVSAFYWDLNDGTRDFSKRFEEQYSRHWPPNDMQAGIYGGIEHYLKAVAAGADPDDGRAVVEKMKQIPVDDVIFGKGVVRADGRTTHTVYLFQVKTPAESKGEWDVFKTVSSVPADQAYRPLDQGGCPLVK
jgi:branched-chain amino acid transport system substrate-binding protein